MAEPFKEEVGPEVAGACAAESSGIEHSAVDGLPWSMRVCMGGQFLTALKLVVIVSVHICGVGEEAPAHQACSTELQRAQYM